MAKLFKNLNKKQWLMILLCILIMIFQVWLDLKLPDFMSKITKLIQTDNIDKNEILIQGGFMLLCAFSSMICAIIIGYIA